MSGDFEGSVETVGGPTGPSVPVKLTVGQIPELHHGEQTERSLFAADTAGIKSSCVNDPDENSPRDAEVIESISGENSV